ncbi:MAG TPA: hypothetical protein VLI93_08735 [Acetobacteraceae bacterium]|nr:hypothetical protein [Acetobacteraceae bacterium]
MPDVPSHRSLESEFDALMARAELKIPRSRRAGYLAAFADLREQIALLHPPRNAAVEPANVFRLTPLERAR